MTNGGDGRGGRAHRAAEGALERLGLIVEQEARRTLATEQLGPDPKRLAEGWERRFITDATRADEVLELYRELGYEVCADPVEPSELGEECDDCQLALLAQLKTIYTRRKQED